MSTQVICTKINGFAFSHRLRLETVVRREQDWKFQIGELHMKAASYCGVMDILALLLDVFFCSMTNVFKLEQNSNRRHSLALTQVSASLVNSGSTGAG